MRRADTSPVFRFRTDRFFAIGGQWYFTTREGEDFGPFDNRAEAETRLSRYLDTLSIFHYLRDADPTVNGEEETSEQLVARLTAALGGRSEPSAQAERPAFRTR